MRGFELRYLVALDVLLTERHVGRAAQRLNLSQPAVSNSLAWLRYHFDDELLVRIGNTLQLTPFAETLRAPVRQLLAEINAVASLRANFSPESATGSFRIVMAQPTVATLAPALLRRIANEAPNMSVEIVDVDSDINRFKRGEIDLLVLPWQYLHEEHGREELFSDQWVCIACAENGPAPDEMDRQTFEEARHLLPQGPQPLNSELAAQGIRREVAAIVPPLLIPDVIVGTPWLACVPELLLTDAQREKVTVYSYPFRDSTIHYGQQWHAEADKDPRLLWLRSIVRQVVQKLELTPPSVIASPPVN